MLHYCDWLEKKGGGYDGGGDGNGDGGGDDMAAPCGYLGSNPVVAAIDFANGEDTAVFVLSLEGDAENDRCSGLHHYGL